MAAVHLFFVASVFRGSVGRTATVRGHTAVRASSAPLGQDPSELFELYGAPADAASRLPAGEAPRPLGVTKRRGEVHRDGDWHRSVHVWLVDERGDLLVQQRSIHKDTFPGRWDVSAAGHVSAGATALETACDEVREELGLELSSEMLSAGWCATLPSCATGETSAGAFVCREYQDLYVVRAAAPLALDSLALGSGEVAAVRTVGAREIIDAWERASSQYVPRPPHYRKELRLALARIGVLV
jgi:isopentenyldiphosphate isomerase